MRKWMRDRLQRRKKKTAEPAAPAAPPLQPAYFDVDASVSEAQPADNAEAASFVPAEPEEVEAAQEEPAASETPAPSRPRSGEGSRGGAKGRRRRGGRGRGGRGREQAVAQAFTPAAAKGIIPEVPAEAEGEAVEPSEPIAEAEAGVEVATAETAAPSRKAPAAPVAAQAAGRPPKGIVVLAIGLPGSGKSSWFKRHNLTPLSSDMVRSLLFDDVREQRFQDLVFSNLRSMLKARLIAKRPMNYVDATNLTPQERQHWIKLAKDYNYEVHAVFFDVPLEV
ncbi:MAG TPA: AAA family ATPase, partial [Bryobacteraceae bacterium]|nr:AAA family ATPase [Bryobacteraceae bacterium]